MHMTGLLALILAALSLASTDPSPATQLAHVKTLSCSSSVIADGNYGETLVPGGQVTLAPQVCLGDALFEDPYLRDLARIYDPSLNVEETIGVGVLVTMHEAAHSLLETTDETTAECAGMAWAMDLLQNDFQAWYAAQFYDATLPSQYHSRPCA